MGLRGRTQLTNYQLFFVTTTCEDFLPLIEPQDVKDILVNSLLFCNAKYNAEIVAYALMPEHIHLIIHFKAGNQLSQYMQSFKRFTSRKTLDYWAQHQSGLLKKLKYWDRGLLGYKIWQDRFHDVTLYSLKICWTKLNYINNNPVKAGLCDKAEDYPYSSGAFYNGMPDTKIPLTHMKDINLDFVRVHFRAAS